MAGDMQERIEIKLVQALQPFLLEVVNESKLHAGHAGDNGSGESHFRITIVSDRFEGIGRIDRQRLIYDMLRQEMGGGLHALSLKTFTNAEYNRV